MSNSENGNEPDRKAERPGQQPTAEQLRRCQRDIEGQVQRVAQALDPIAETLDNGGHVSREMISHVNAQLLRAHLHLDDLKQLLDSLTSH